MINPIDNRKLNRFHLIVACCFYVDFFLTGFILGNYEFLHMNDNDNKNFIDLPKYLKDECNKIYTSETINTFMNHGSIYFYIIFIQLIDIILNFFIIDVTSEVITDPAIIAQKYMK